MLKVTTRGLIDNKGTILCGFMPYVLTYLSCTNITMILQQAATPSIFMNKHYVFWDKPSFGYFTDAVLTVFEFGLCSVPLGKVVF